MKALRIVLLLFVLLLVAGFGFVYAGIFNVAADQPHGRLAHRLIELARDRSIAVHARDISMPSLDERALLAAGAEHYSAMCSGCHLAPGLEETELRAGLSPKPPNLVEHGARRSPEQAFWIIKHGLKMTGMPAWGVTHDDESIWGIVAFVRRLPVLSPEEYRLLAQGRNGGHSHAGGGRGDAADRSPADRDSPDDTNGQTEGHSHDHGAHDEKPHSHDSTSASPPGAALPASTVEPVAVVERFFRALAAGDTASASAVLDPSVLIYESGGAERSREEYASHHLGADAAFLKNASHRLLSRTGGAAGDLAWVATETRLTARARDASTDLIGTETMVLRKTGSAWRIVHIHWSNRAAG